MKKIIDKYWYVVMCLGLLVSIHGWKSGQWVYFIGLALVAWMLGRFMLKAK